jgi:hypothetical protein
MCSTQLEKGGCSVEVDGDVVVIQVEDSSHFRDIVEIELSLRPEVVDQVYQEIVDLMGNRDVFEQACQPMRLTKVRAPPRI